MIKTPNSILLGLFSKYPLRRQLILLMIIVFTILGTILYFSLSKLTQDSIFHEVPLVGLNPTLPVESGADENLNRPNPTVVVDLDSLQSAALDRLDSRLQKIIAWTITGGLIFGLGLAIWLSTFISTPIKNLAQEISSAKKTETEAVGYTMPSQELSELHSAILSSLHRFEERLDDQNQFMLDVAHEFRTPVASIRMKIDVDRKKTNVSPDDFYSLCQAIDRSTTRLEQLLDNFIGLSKSENQIQVSNVNIDKVMHECIEVLRPLALTQKVEVKPPAESNLWLRTEPLFLQTIITNLVENAIKYTNQNGKVAIFVKAVVDGCDIRIADNGIGISKDEIGKVFNRFYRVDISRSRQLGGSGLGLPTVKTLLNRLGGRISIQSELGVGTEVEIFIPNQHEGFDPDNNEKEKHEKI